MKRKQKLEDILAKLKTIELEKLDYIEMQLDNLLVILGGIGLGILIISLEIDFDYTTRTYYNSYNANILKLLITLTSLSFIIILVFHYLELAKREKTQYN